MHGSGPQRFLIGVFLALILAPPLIQVAAEAGRGGRPLALEVFLRWPTPGNLRAFEKSMEEASVVARALRPWWQALEYFALCDGGAKARISRAGWWFYQPGIAFLTQRPQAGEATVGDALAAVVQFRDDLAARGIRLVIMPAPNKESVYPDKLAPWAPPPADILSADTRAFLAGCRDSGVDVIDLFALYRERRRASAEPLYLSQDSHWSPAGLEVAAEAVAQHLRSSGLLTNSHTAFDVRPASVSRPGDLIRMARSPVIERRVRPETSACSQVVRSESGAVYADDAISDVLVMGDSFLRIFQQDAPGGAGFVAHLARKLGRPVASIINDGGASTLVRQELFRRAALLENKRVVIWEFVERDLRLGTEGWPLIPLPARSTPGAPARP